MSTLALYLERRWKKAEYTIGILYINGVYFCEVLENPVRPEKILGHTAIPAGTYRIDMNTVSPRFKGRAWAVEYNGIVPRLLAVPNYTGVLIHPGNTTADTTGCLLPGRNRAIGKVLDSQTTYKRLMDEYLIPARNNGTKITIKIE